MICARSIISARSPTATLMRRPARRKRGSSPAFVALGRYYLTGIPSTKIAADRARARDMFGYAATYFGDADAQYELGQLYLTGTPSDPHQAARWLQLAATKGHCRAEVTLGNLLFEGQVVPRQAARGLMWLMFGRDCAGADESWVTPNAPWPWSI
jgi:uncharacterized protein